MKLDLNLLPWTKFNYKWMKNLNMKPDTLSLVEDKRQNTLELNDMLKDLSNMTQIFLDIKTNNKYKRPYEM